MRRLAAALLLLCAPVAAHAADNFTFSTVNKPIEGVRVPLQGQSFQGAQVFSFTSDVTYADGHKESIAGKCGGWKNPPGAQFDQSGACVAPKNYTMQYSCQPETGKNASNCWGYLVGAPEGAFKGRTGVLAYRTTATGVIGVGRWND
jgi:hypothetical protein